MRARLPFNDNMLLPCQLIDQPHVFRELFDEFQPYPTHPGAETLVNGLGPALDEHACRCQAAMDPVWREAFRVLRPGGAILTGMMNPAYYCFDFELAEMGEVKIRHKLPYSDIVNLDEATLEKHRQRGLPLEFSHSLTDQLAGQLEAGFVLAGFYEDDFGPDIPDPISDYMPTMMATRAVKPRHS